MVIYNVRICTMDKKNNFIENGYIEIENGNWYLNEYSYEDSWTRRKLKCSPYEQAEKSMRHSARNGNANLCSGTERDC